MIINLVYMQNTHDLQVKQEYNHINCYIKSNTSKNLDNSRNLSAFVKSTSVWVMAQSLKELTPGNSYILKVLCTLFFILF